jgi:hypothetical protein
VVNPPKEQTMRNRLGKAFSAAALTITAATAWADGSGLVLREDSPSWPRWQARLGLGSANSFGLRGEQMQRGDSSEFRLGSLSLMGDYYLTGPLLGGSRLSGGLRATSGLVVGPRGALLSSPALPAQQGSPFSLTRLVGGMPLSALDANPDVGTVPYLGIGYTGVSNKGGLSFSADLGIAAMNPGPGLHFGRVVSGSQNFDDMLRDLRLTPVIQLGVSYSF